ncbi:MAG: hypothetical protein R3F02_00105 [Thiolinea sp.]
MSDAGLSGAPGLLNGFGGRIDGNELSALLQKTLTTLEYEYNELNVFLVSQSWELAADKAHQLKGSAYLFECEEILACLELIADKNTDAISSAAFRENIKQQVGICLGRLRRAKDNCV